MEKIEKDRVILKKLFSEWQAWPRIAPFRVVPVWDEFDDRYVLLTVGWDGYKRIHSVLVDVSLHEGLFWIEADSTPDGFALDLAAAGVPKSRIVLAFKHPELRQFSEFGQAA